MKSLFIYTIGFVLTCCPYFSGCSTATVSFQEIILAAKEVDASDGVDEEEAVITAQNLIVGKGLDDRLYSIKPYKVKKETFYIKAGGKKVFTLAPWGDPDFDVYEHWHVYFKDREGSFLKGLYPVMPFTVEINAKTGEVIRWGLEK